MASQSHTDQPHRSTWTDERLDDLVQVIRDGFARNEEEHRQFRIEMRTMEKRLEERFDRTDDRFDRMDDRFDRTDDRSDRVDDRFDRLEDRIDRVEGTVMSLQRTMMIGMLGLTGTVLATLVTVLLRG